MTSPLDDTGNPYTVIRKIAEGVVGNPQAACERWLREHDEEPVVHIALDTEEIAAAVRTGDPSDVFVLWVPDGKQAETYRVLADVLDLQFGLSDEHVLYPKIDVDKWGREVEKPSIIKDAEPAGEAPSGE